MKKLKSVIAIAIAVCLVAVCLPLLASADTTVSFEVSFVDDTGASITSLSNGDTFWAQIKMTDYQTVGDISGEDYVRAIAHAFIYLDVSGVALTTDEDGYALITSPFIDSIAVNEGTITADLSDGVLSIGFEASSVTGDYCITNADLVNSEGAFINVRLIAVSDDTVSAQVNTDSSVSLLTTGSDWEIENVDSTVGAAVEVSVAAGQSGYDYHYDINSADNVSVQAVTSWDGVDNIRKAPTDDEITAANTAGAEWLFWQYNVASAKCGGLYDSSNDVGSLHMLQSYSSSVGTRNGYANFISADTYDLGTEFNASFSFGMTNCMAAGKPDGTTTYFYNEDWTQFVNIGDLTVGIRYTDNAISKESYSYTNEFEVYLSYNGTELDKSDYAVNSSSWGTGSATTSATFDSIWTNLNAALSSSNKPDYSKNQYLDLNVNVVGGVVTVTNAAGNVVCSGDILDAGAEKVSFNDARIAFKAHDVGTVSRPGFVSNINLDWNEMQVITGASLTLGDNVAVNFYLSDSAATAYSVDSLAMVVDEKEYAATEDSDGTVYFVYDDVTPATLGETITAEIVNTEDSTVLDTVEYSAEQYCYTMLYKSDDDLTKLGVEDPDKLRTMIVDLLKYSESARQYFDVEDGKVVTKGLDINPSLKAYASNSDLELDYDLVLDTTENASKDVKWMSAGLELTRSVSIRLKVQLADTVAPEDITLHANGSEVENYELTKVSGNNYYLYYRDLNPAQMKDIVTFSIYCGEDQVSTDITYSVQSYAYNALNNQSSKTALCDLVTAMMRYGESTKNYIS